MIECRILGDHSDAGAVVVHVKVFEWCIVNEEFAAIDVVKTLE